ncbi:hypothetical protein [Caulobacter sp. S45]|uniref:hypothetical protein n=1 Tax=Caulobacter sp. S45 TaxID=1641861 RepID=UPI00157530A9|nr:hypothetical protein [Caulobacter sp. S45]
MNRRAMAVAAVLAALCGPVAAGAQPVPETPNRTKAEARADDARAARLDGQGGCIYINQLQGSHPLNDRTVIFRANVSDFYELDFADKCYALTFPDPKLIIVPFGGEGLVCHAIDLNVKVSEQGPGAIAEPCIPSAFHKMTPAEVAAVPKKTLP